VQPVSVGAVRRQDVHLTLQAIGTIAAANTAVVRTRIEGELKVLHFKEGQLVQAGALLAELDDRAQRIALAQAEGQLARDQAQLHNARVDLARFKDLLAKDGVSRQQVDTQDALVRQLQGTVQIDQAQVDNARLQLSYTRITAPISGRAGLRQADLGNTVRPSDANGLLSIAQTHPVNVVFAVPDAHLPRIAQALREKQPLEVQAWDREQKQRLAAGGVTSADNAIDSATGTIKLKASFPNADDGLFPNQFVNVRLHLGTLSDALTVPAAAVLRNAEGSFVYVVGEDKTVAVRPVQLSVAEGDWVAVKGELQDGERVVTEGVDRLRDGARVEPMRPGGAREGAPPGERGAGPSPERLAELLQRLPPEVAETVKAMSPEERREWFRRAREERLRRQATAAQ
jgi:multidrug efflux system membrane fusion protein